MQRYRAITKALARRIPRFRSSLPIPCVEKLHDLGNNTATQHRNATTTAESLPELSSSQMPLKPGAWFFFTHQRKFRLLRRIALKIITKSFPTGGSPPTKERIETWECEEETDGAKYIMRIFIELPSDVRDCRERSGRTGFHLMEYRVAMKMIPDWSADELFQFGSRDDSMLPRMPSTASLRFISHNFSMTGTTVQEMDGLLYGGYIRAMLYEYREHLVTLGDTIEQKTLTVNEALEKAEETIRIFRQRRFDLGGVWTSMLYDAESEHCVNVDCSEAVPFSALFSSGNISNNIEFEAQFQERVAIAKSMNESEGYPTARGFF